MTGLTVQTTGFAELDAALGRLDAKVAKSIGRKSLRPAIKPIQKAAKANAPVLTGALRQSIKVRTVKSRNRSRIAVQITTSDKTTKAGKRSLYIGEQFYGAFVEFGTERMEGRHFMEEAFEKNWDDALRIVKQQLGTRIEQEARK